MLKYSFRLAIVLALVCALPIIAIRALPYHDRVSGALVVDDCPLPCLMGIRPGVTTMQEAASVLQSHPWVANHSDGFFAQIRSATTPELTIPRTAVGVRWSAAVPAWIDGQRGGSVAVEAGGVEELMADTRLTLGEVVLTFGDPDQAWYVASSSLAGKRFVYVGWYASSGMLVSTEGACPIWGYYNLPVRVRFRTEPPRLSDSATKISVCG